MPSDKIRATLFLVSVPTLVNDPPIYHPPLPSEIVAKTCPLTFGYVVASVPVVVSTGAPKPTFGPTWVNVPPI